METRSPDDFELFLELILEAPRGQREIFPHKQYKPAWKNDPTANQFPCGGNIGNGNCGANGNGCANGNCGAPGAPVVGTVPLATPAAEVAPNALPTEPTTLPPMTTMYPPGATRASRQ